MTDISTLEQTWTFWQPGMISTGIIALAIIIGSLAGHIFFKIFEKLASRDESGYMQPLVKYWRQPSILALILLLIYFIFPFLQFPEPVLGFLRHMMTVLLIGIITWLAIRTTYMLRDIITAKHSYTKEADNLDERRIYTQLNILVRITVIIITILGVSLGLMTFPEIQKIGVSILASAGVLGIIIGFAAQSSLSNLLAGVQLAFTQPIRIDDVVIVEGEWGVVEDINLTFVVIRIWDKRRLVVPIKFFLENTFQNWTRVSADLLGTVYLYVDYDVPVEAVREELNRICEGSDLWDRIAAGVQITGTTESSVEMRALVSSSNAGKLWELRCMVREKLVDFIRKNYPQSLPRTRVELGRAGS